ncbi:MAG: alkaline shock response membrane anchor protein AmaP [Actinomycetota bacterium]|nr:alkaline shock response membrane anchor protein AmaP [Actinomycetota bacterium]
MISRKLLLADRFAALILAAALIAAGALGALWWSGRTSLPDRTSTQPLLDVVDADWWPWVSAVAGIALILLGLKWVLAHLANPKVRRLRLPSSGVSGKLEVDGSKVVDAAAESFSSARGVRNVKGTLVRDRGQLTARLHAVIEPDADLHDLAKHAEEVSSHLQHVLQRDDLRFSVQLRTARRPKPLPRVD